jgi:membrane protein YdbS with pleckstrin-like domain
MTLRSDYRRRSGISRLIGILLIIWLIVGAIAAGQRGYYSSAKSNCASAATIAVTILAGPLNYLGVNPKVHCKVPQPSK